MNSNYSYTIFSLRYIRLLLFLCLIIFFSTSSIRAIETKSSVIEYYTKCTIERNQCEVERSILIEITNRSDEKYAEVAIPFSKREKVTILLAQIEDVNGTVIRQLKRSDFKDRSAIAGYSLFEDDLVKTFELKHNVYPYRIRYQWKYEYLQFFEIVNWRPYFDNIQTRFAKLEVTHPLDYQTKIFKNNIPHSSVDTVETNLVYSFEITEFQLPNWEVNCAPRGRNAPYVQITPVYFKWVTEGSSLSWRDFGNWINNLNEGLEDLSSEDVAKVRFLVKGKTEKYDIIRTLYKYLQDETRYINVTIGTGGLKPYPASYVALNRYGDCKALTIFMKSMLKVVDIPSYYSIIYAGESNPGIVKEITGIQFNHAVLCVPLEKDTLYLDCTRKNVPPGYMGTFTQGREVFVIKKDSSHFKTISFLTSNEVLEHQIHNYHLTGINDSRVSITRKDLGNAFDNWASAHNMLNHLELEQFLRDRYFSFSSFELEKWELNQPHKDSAFYNLKASIKLNNFLKSYGNDLGFSIYPLDIPDFEKPANRKLPLTFYYPLHVVDSFIYNLAPTFKLKMIPENQVIEAKFGKYSLTSEVNQNVLIIRRNFEIFKGDYVLTDYPDFYSFIQKVQKNNRLVIMLTQ